jgi:hypothetical protein
MNPLEAIADAIMHFEGWVPGSRSYRDRNPGNLEGPSKRALGKDGVYNHYSSLIDGYQDLLDELKAKFSGNNKHGIGPDSTLLDLFNVYAPPSDNNPTNKYCEFVADFASHALGMNIEVGTVLKDIWVAS